VAKAAFCTRCYQVGFPRKETKGSFLVEVALWIFLIVPGLLYSLWRLSTRHPVCRACGSPELVPPTSDRARMLAGARS
jgi:hypothetical protein